MREFGGVEVSFEKFVTASSLILLLLFSANAQSSDARSIINLCNQLFSNEHYELAILKLYEIRSEPLMRQARAWFMSEFKPQSGLEILALLQSGEKQSAFYRMVSSHWEVASALVNNGGIDEKMFLEANTEHLVVFAKLQPFIAEIRETIGEPDYLTQLEHLVMKAENIERKLENRRRLLERWTGNKTGANSVSTTTQ